MRGLMLAASSHLITCTHTHRRREKFSDCFTTIAKNMNKHILYKLWWHAVTKRRKKNLYVGFQRLSCIFPLHFWSVFPIARFVCTKSICFSLSPFLLLYNRRRWWISFYRCHRIRSLHKFPHANNFNWIRPPRWLFFSHVSFFFDYCCCATKCTFSERLREIRIRANQQSISMLKDISVSQIKIDLAIYKCATSIPFHFAMLCAARAPHVRACVMCMYLIH